MVATADNEDVLARVDRVRVQFGSLVAVRDVSLTLRPGYLVGLIGPNGAGKTTLLRAIAGLQPLSTGRIEVLAERVEPGWVGYKHHIGFTPDTPWLFDQLTVREFLRFIAKGYHISPETVDERIDFWLDQVWLTEKQNQKIKELSRGMRQRVGIARTLLPNPSVVLLDEPAAGLDPAGRAQFRRLLCSLRHQGKALIVSSHILADLNEYCTHIAIMAHGSIVQHGTVEQVANAGNGETGRYTVILVRPVPDLKDRLSQIEGIGAVEVDGDRFIVEFSRHREDAAGLLLQLIRLKLPVASFAPNTPDLEEAYLRTGIRQVD
ncbi:MAG TPA: ABC transporter ATP-binding protein [Phycisphaerae bacterium]|nr:ABC transporter ATP-binding protein [Phycisphaerae bacterium]HRR85048.1 ABC transporter ATP-binding protein [Phycisphaerae bacterium]